MPPDPPEPPPDDTSACQECLYCGLVQTMPRVANGQDTECARCGSVLARARADWLGVARASAVLALVFFVLALTLPFVTLRTVGRYATSTLLTGPQMLGDYGFSVLGVVVLLTLVAMPAAKVLSITTVLFGMLAPRPPRFLAWLFGWYAVIDPWAMLEVFLLGAFVAYTRLRALASVEVGAGVLALGGAMLTLVAVDGTLDRGAIWRELEAKEARLGRNATHLRAPHGPVRTIGCHTCGKVTRAREGQSCPRCSHLLHYRKKHSAQRAWALLVTALLLYVPANVLPVMTVTRMGSGGPTTILHGVQELALEHLWPLAVIVVLASVVVPAVKLVSLAAMLILTHRRSDKYIRARTRMYGFVRAIGRWSMIDIFMLTTLVGVVHFGFLAEVRPGMGAVAFCGVVLVTMVATDAFDPRLMWDATASASAAPDTAPGAPSS